MGGFLHSTPLGCFEKKLVHKGLLLISLILLATPLLLGPVGRAAGVTGPEGPSSMIWSKATWAFLCWDLGPQGQVRLGEAFPCRKESGCTVPLGLY